MVGKLFKAAACAAWTIVLAGCGGGMPDDFYDEAPRHSARSQSGSEAGAPLQCVPYARDHSGIKIFGDAYTWWEQAAARYRRDSLPEEGAVMVLNNYAGPRHGHVAVVRRIVSDREIRVDHANWMNDGAVYINNPVRDESPANDWTKVRVFNIQSGQWGTRIYPVQGFILPQTPDAPTPPRRDGDLLVAKIQDALATPLAEAALGPSNDEEY